MESRYFLVWVWVFSRLIPLRIHAQQLASVTSHILGPFAAWCSQDGVGTQGL